MSDKKKKANPSSRYSRIEEPWPDDIKDNENDAPSADLLNGGYGVRDSYSRQASYGKPDGWYDPGYDMPDEDNYTENPETDGRDDDPDSSYDAWDDPGYDDRYTSGRRSGDSGRYASGRQSGDSGRYASRRQSGDSGYDDTGYDDRYTSRRRFGDSGYEDIRYEAGPGRGKYREHTPLGRTPRRGTKTKARGRGGFIVRLILLILAAMALLVIWRMSRMQRTVLSDILTNAGITQREGYQDFVIYGVDSRDGSLTKEAHSDTIIICSMNKSAKEIKMVSVYRDTYLDNTNGEYRKATECYYFGGPERSVNMLNKNLDLDIGDYLTVDFNAVVKAVDLIGGVEVEVTEDELPYINGYQTENSSVTGAEITPVTQAGYQTLNGIQALAYCRIRYTAGSDYKRTERQRTVLTQVFQKARQQGTVKLLQIVDTMLPYIATSFSNTELASLASGISDYTLGESTGFPFELQAANISAGDCVVPVNLAQNVSELHAFLYGDSGYVPSDTVQEISAQITASTGIG